MWRISNARVFETHIPHAPPWFPVFVRRPPRLSFHTFAEPSLLRGFLFPKKTNPKNPRLSFPILWFPLLLCVISYFYSPSSSPRSLCLFVSSFRLNIFPLFPNLIKSPLPQFRNFALYNLGNSPYMLTFFLLSRLFYFGSLLQKVFIIR